MPSQNTPRGEERTEIKPVPWNLPVMKALLSQGRSPGPPQATTKNVPDQRRLRFSGFSVKPRLLPGIMLEKLNDVTVRLLQLPPKHTHLCEDQVCMCVSCGR